jgi:hypothetical protein
LANKGYASKLDSEKVFPFVKVYQMLTSKGKTKHKKRGDLQNRLFFNLNNGIISLNAMPYPLT